MPKLATLKVKKQLISLCLLFPGFPLVDCKEAPHKVLISSEEQLKMFYLPTLKPAGKFKVTANEGARIRKVGFTTFFSKSDPGYSENCLTCLTNQGKLFVKHSVKY